MCNACFSDNKVKTTTTLTVELDKIEVVIKNVPCLKCPVCGETTLTDEVSARLEELVNTTKSVAKEDVIIDFANTD